MIDIQDTGERARRTPPPAAWRIGTLAAAGVLVLLGWAYLVGAVTSGHDISGLGPGMAALAPVLEMVGAGGDHAHGLGAADALDIAAIFAMWVAMVLAMMLPTALPTLRAYSAAGRAAPLVAVGYLAVWIAVSAAATAGQAALITGGALSPEMAPAGVALSASVLIAAGIYQFTPLKHACLVRCRNPRASAVGVRTTLGALRIGIDEGLACLGCCWAMMAVMAAAGLMNLVAMAFLGALMALEKVVSGLILTYSTGVILLVLGFGLASSLFIG